MPDPALAALPPILILEDDLMVGDIQCKMLEKLGYRSVWTKNGQETVDACKQALSGLDPFRIALLDLTVDGGMGGREAAPLLREIDPTLKLLACSGYVEEDLDPELAQLGFIDALGKPFSLKELDARLRKHLFPAA